MTPDQGFGCFLMLAAYVCIGLSLWGFGDYYNKRIIKRFGFSMVFSGILIIFIWTFILGLRLFCEV